MLIQGIMELYLINYMANPLNRKSFLEWLMDIRAEMPPL